MYIVGSSYVHALGVQGDRHVAEVNFLLAGQRMAVFLP
jgi:hypothetical protein